MQLVYKHFNYNPTRHVIRLSYGLVFDSWIRSRFPREALSRTLAMSIFERIEHDVTVQVQHAVISSEFFVDVVVTHCIIQVTTHCLIELLSATWNSVR